jgi:DNA-binding NarL/FixJ family response regulator
LEEATDFKLAEAGDPESVLRRAREFQPHVIVMDIFFPNYPATNGIELVRTLKKELPEARAVMYTIYSGIERIEAAARAGASGYLPKGHAEELADAIQRVHNGEIYFGLNRRYNIHIVDMFRTGSDPTKELTNKERVICYVLRKAGDLAHEEIGEILDIDPKTVRTHLVNIYHRFSDSKMLPDNKKKQWLVDFARAHQIMPSEEGVTDDINTKLVRWDVFVAAGEIFRGHVKQRDPLRFTIEKDRDRAVVITFGRSRDVSVCETHEGNTENKVAIVVKAGTGVGTLRERAGQAENSHIVAKAKGFRELWTIISKKGIDVTKLRAEFPTTTFWFDVEEVLARRGQDWDEFRARLMSEVGIAPDTSGGHRGSAD